MAERFGGKYSPGGTPQTTPQPEPGPYAGKRRFRGRARLNMLFIAPVVFLLGAFRGDPPELALNLAAFAVLTLATWLTREGIVAQEAFEARAVARRPAIPRKLFGTALTAVGLFLGGYEVGQGPANPLIFAALGAILHLAAFGPDPLRSKGIAGVDAHDNARVARAVEEGEKHLAAMQGAIRAIGDRRLEARVDRFAAAAHDMFRRIEQDPRDLSASRRYLGVYLLGARDATAKFAGLYQKSRDAQARKDYEALLDDLETNFKARSTHLLRNDRDDLDIEIEVLRERLKREGVASGQA